MSIEYFVACTHELPMRPQPWDEPFGPVSIALLPPQDSIRLELEARLGEFGVTEVVIFSSRASAGHLAFQFATALAKMSSGVLFDEESFDEPLADYRGHPAVVLSGGIEVIWEGSMETERRAEAMRALRDLDEWEAISRLDPRTEEENDWTDVMS